MADMVPFFVADRPMSLRLLKGLPLDDYPGVRIGIMAHANTTENFQLAFHDYPCDNLEYCDAIGGPCQFKDDISSCPFCKPILNHTVKMCDSGIFTREGATLTYEELFQAYKRMGVEYGVMIDVFQDPEATLESAKEALQAYGPFKDDFELVAVAHGDSVEEYVNCYEQLKELGFEYIAVGGLLRRRKNTVRFPYLRSQEFMFDVLGELRERYPEDWLFALGCFHPKRLSGLKELDVWADYKGWIFQYEKRNETLDSHLETFTSNHVQHLDMQSPPPHLPSLLHTITLRDKLIELRDEFSQSLISGKRSLRSALQSLHEELQEEELELAPEFSELTTHGLLDSKEKRLVGQAFDDLSKSETEEADEVLVNIRENRRLKESVKGIERLIDQLNITLGSTISALLAENDNLSAEVGQICIKIKSVVERTEREHRFGQVRENIAEEILDSLVV